MEMKAMLRGFGGKGRMDDGTPIYRLITGTVYPLGIGFTMKPAANVKGVISNETTETIEKPKESKAIILESNKKASKELEKVAAKI